MPTTTEKEFPTLKNYDLPVLSIADASDMMEALTEMFHAYVWNCTSHDEELHKTICFVYHGLIGMLKNSEPPHS